MIVASTSRRVLLTTSWLALAACSGRAPRATPQPAPTPADPAPASGGQPAKTLPPGTYEPFEPPPPPPSVRRDTPAAEASQAEVSRRGAVSQISGEPSPAGPQASYFIQVAAYAEREPADDLARLLARRYVDYPARVVARGGLYRVWIGGWPSRDDAASVLVIVRQRYPDAWVVTP